MMSGHISIFQKLAFIGTFMSGIAFLATAIIALISLLIVNLKQMDDGWLDRFRNLYGSFWNDNVMSEVREWIINDRAYEEHIKDTLINRNKMENCSVSAEEHIRLEKIDRFCALMIRARSFGKDIHMTKTQEELWGKALYRFWVEKLLSRPELKKYVINHWKELGEEVVVIRRMSPFNEVVKRLRQPEKRQR